MYERLIPEKIIAGHNIHLYVNKKTEYFFIVSRKTNYQACVLVTFEFKNYLRNKSVK